jgi:hypothetical protein
MTTLTLTVTLLHVLTALKDKQALAISESILGIIPDWHAELRTYLFNFPGDTITCVGLAKNEKFFQYLCRFKIPAEWNDTPRNQLHQFTFTY